VEIVGGRLHHPVLDVLWIQIISAPNVDQDLPGVFTHANRFRFLRGFSLLKPEFHYADFHRNFPAGKVVDTSHQSGGHKPSRHVEMFATKSATKSATSSRQSRGLVADTNHESRRRDLCCGLSWFVSSTLSRTCPGLCRFTSCYWRKFKLEHFPLSFPSHPLFLFFSYFFPLFFLLYLSLFFLPCLASFLCFFSSLFFPRFLLFLRFLFSNIFLSPEYLFLARKNLRLAIEGLSPCTPFFTPLLLAHFICVLKHKQQPTVIICSAKNVTFMNEA